MDNNSNSKFNEFIAEEIAKYSGVAMPINAGFLSRTLIRKAPCTKLHPNPDDEFSIPSVGPSYRIISEYEKKFRYSGRYNMKNYFDGQEPIIVEKMHPDGYRILNGHHRWAAAIRIGAKNIPIQIVNVTHNQEIKDILRNSTHDKRVTMDLDEVIFFNPGNRMPEKPLSFPFNKLYKEQLRLGVPALFRNLELHGYDIWLYSSKYYSTDYIKALFHKYHVNVTGIVTGTGHRKNKDDKKAMEALFANKYKHTIHIDNDMAVLIDNATKDFVEYTVTNADSWSKELMDIVREIN